MEHAVSTRFTFIPTTWNMQQAPGLRSYQQHGTCSKHPIYVHTNNMEHAASTRFTFIPTTWNMQQAPDLRSYQQHGTCSKHPIYVHTHNMEHAAAPGFCRPTMRCGYNGK